MALDMKDHIAAAATKLIFKDKVDKLTVTNVVEECHITRQAFYYHFADIPDLIRWMLEQQEDNMLEEYLSLGNPEEVIKSFFRLGLNIRPYVVKGIQTNYGEEIERLMIDYIYRLFEKIIGETGDFKEYSELERDLFLNYHSHAFMGVLQSWPEEKEDNLDEVASVIYGILCGEISL